MDSEKLLSSDIRVADDDLSIVDINRAHHYQTITAAATTTTIAPTTNTVSQVITTTGSTDLRAAKGELFSKLIEPQQMIVTPSSSSSTSANKILSSEDVSRTRTTDDGLNRLQITNSGMQQQQQQQQQDQGFIQQGSPVAVYSRVRSKWYTNEEVASILTSFESHPEWRTEELRIRPESGAVLLYSREKVRYRQDGYCWKKRKNGRTTREDHMKLKVQGVECIYGCYVHSALLPTFHRRCYWLLENPDIVLVHYLNQPADDKSKTILTFDPDVLEQDTRRRWTNEEIIEEIGAVFGGISQIHHTLSLNLPNAEQQQQQAAVGDVDQATHVISNTSSGPLSEVVDKTMAGGNSNNNNSNNNNSEPVREEDEMDLDGRSNDGRQMDQDPCSPVTQIYNKIVDDIETYVLPIEPNQYNPNPDILHQQQQRHLQQQQQQQQQQRQQNDHHNLSSSGISVQTTMDTSDSSMTSDDNHHHRRAYEQDYVNHQVLSLEQHGQSQQPFSIETHHQHGGGGGGGGGPIASSHVEGQIDCPSSTVNLSSCDLLGSCGLDQLSDSDQHGGCKANDGGDMLLTDYNNVTSNMDDMSDLMIGCLKREPDESSAAAAAVNSNTDRNHQLVIESDPLNSFLFTPCDQLDIKSTVSDIGSSHRLSPMTVPRCNSTDNALRISSSDHHHPSHQFHHHHTHHNLHHYQSSGVGNGCTTTANDFLDYTVGHPNRSTASTEASNSTSCSASPSSSSLLPVRAGSYLSSVSPTNVCMKLPLQQRQNSEQKEPSNSVLNSLLPKALSLDGSDLSTSHRYNHHQHYYQHHHHHQNYNHNNNNNNISNNHHHNSNNNSNYNHRKSPLISSYGHHSRVVHRLGTNNQQQQQQQQHNLAARSRHASVACTDLGTLSSQQQQQQNLLSYRKLSHAKTVQILDYVPNWSPSSGGAKVLIIGDWSGLFNSATTSSTLAAAASATTNCTSLQINQELAFHVLFEDQLVPATLIQDNVLRCHTPPLKAGFISLKVLYGEIAVTEQMLFEVRADSPPPPQALTAAAATTTTNSMAPLASMGSMDIHNDHLAAGRTDSAASGVAGAYLQSPIAVKMESSEEQTGQQQQQQQQQQQIVSSQNMD